MDTLSLPWKLKEVVLYDKDQDNKKIDSFLRIEDMENKTVCHFFDIFGEGSVYSLESAHKNAQYIIRAVNNYPILIKTLKDILGEE